MQSLKLKLFSQQPVYNVTHFTPCLEVLSIIGCPIVVFLKKNISCFKLEQSEEPAVATAAPPEPAAGWGDPPEIPDDRGLAHWGGESPKKAAAGEEEGGSPVKKVRR